MTTRITTALIIAALFCACPPAVHAEERAALGRPPPEMQPVLEDASLATVSTLRTLVSLSADLRADIQKLNRQAVKAETAAEKQQILTQIEKLSTDLSATQRNIEELAAGAHLDSIRTTTEETFDFTRELFSLLEPAINEMKDMTSHVRQKAEQREKIAYFEARVPITETAISNLNALLADTQEKELRQALTDLQTNWKKQDTFLRAELQSARVQLAKLEASEQTLAEASESYLKSFYQNRGRYLGQALLAVVAVLLLSRLLMKALVRFVSGFQQANRPLRLRLVDLGIRLLTVILAIAGPMVIFYLAEDWLLFSLGLLLLIGIGLGLRQAVPRYWHQVQLFLNVGTVREGERVLYAGLPWRVRQINVYTMLDNPDLGISQRLKIDDLVDLRSRPLHRNEPWFPCRLNDWVRLDDGSRGKLVGVSQEFVELVERGGAHKTLTTQDFLNHAPLNLSVNFRLKESIGISYDLQHESVTTVPELLRAHVERRLADEGYADQLLNLRVEFERAAESSLNLVIIADFRGELAEFYNRLRRSLQRYAVEACTAHGWEIPFTQITLHKATSP